MNSSIRDKSPATLIVLKSLVLKLFIKNISNAMNSFFCSVGKDLADKIDPAPNPFLAGDYEINKPKATFHFRTIEVQEIRVHLPQLRQQRALGLTTSLATF